MFVYKHTETIGTAEEFIAVGNWKMKKPQTNEKIEKWGHIEQRILVAGFAYYFYFPRIFDILRKQKTGGGQT